MSLITTIQLISLILYLIFNFTSSADAGAGGGHMGDGGAAAAREAPARQETAQGHVLPAATPDAGE